MNNTSSSNNNAAATSIAETKISNNLGRTYKIRVGSMVEVARRMWPGINQPGGTARVLGIHTAEEPGIAGEAVIIAVDVHYIVEGRKEKRVPIQYVTHSPQYEAEEEGFIRRDGGGGGQRRFLLRDRSQLLGRCKNCGSLRADCGACDWMMIEESSHNTKGLHPDPSVAAITTRTNVTSCNSSNEDTQSSTSSEDDDDDLLNRRLPMLLSSTNKTKHLHSFLNDQVFGGKRRPAKPEPRPRRTPRGKSVLETFSTTYAGSDSGNQDTKNSKTLKAGLPTADIQKLYSSTLSSPSEDENDVLPKTTKFKRLTKVTALLSQEEEEAALTSNRNDLSSSTQAESIASVDLEPLSSSQISLYRDYYECGGLDDQLFIQPEAEGEIVMLPNDVLDRTVDLTHDQLPNFFDELASKVQHILIPKFQIELMKIQGKKSESEQQPFLRLLYQQICQELIRDGVDQLTNCLRKLCLRRREKGTKLTSQQKKHFKLQNERRDLTLELISQKVQTLCKDLRESMISTATATQEDFDDHEGHDDGTTEAKMTNTGSDDSSSHIENFETEFDTTTDDRLLLASFDPHAYAYVRRKRRKKNTVKTARKVHLENFQDFYRHTTNQAFSGNEESDEECSIRKKYSNSVKRRNCRKITSSSVENQRNNLSKQSFHDDQTLVREERTYGAGNDTFREKTGQGNHTSRRRPLIWCTKLERAIKNKFQVIDPKNPGRVNQDHQHDKDIATTARISSTRDAVTHSVMPIQATVDKLYQHLRSKNCKEICLSDLGAIPSTSISTRGSPLHSAPALQDNSNSIDNVLCTIHNYLIINNEKGHNWAELEDNVKSIFMCIHAQLQHSVSLLEWMHTYDNDDRLIEFFIGTFRVIASVDSQILDNLQQDSVCQLLCSPKFGDLVIMQIIDVIYSQRLPKVWVSYYFDTETEKYSPLPIKKLSDSSWRKIVQLIALINQRIPILEAACNVLVKLFKCQQWRLTSTSPIRYFVSSVDSKCIREYLTSGQLVSEGLKRIGSFKKNLPRCEIDTIWAILSTFALQPPFPPKTFMRWQLLDLCLFGSNASVFSNMSSIDKSEKSRIPLPSYPVDPKHLNICHKELQFLIDLINCRAVQPFQKSDTFLIKMLQASIRLHVNSATLDCSFRSNYGKSTHHWSDQDTTEIFLLWEVTDLLRNDESSCRKRRAIDEIVYRLMQENFDTYVDEKMDDSLAGQYKTDSFHHQEFGQMLSLSSRNQIVRIACNLLAVWMRHTIQTEDCNRAGILKNSVEELVSRFMTQAEVLEETYKRTANSEKENSKTDSLNFALLFQEEVNDDSLAAAVCLRESASFLLFTCFCIIANINLINDTVLDSISVSSLRPSCEEMRAALWSAITINSWMQDMQKSLLLGVSKAPTFYDGPLPVFDYSSKVMSGFALCLLQESCYVSLSDDMSLVYAVSCIITDIEGACDILQSLITQEDKFLGPQKQTYDFFYSPDTRQCVKVLSRSCSLLCLILIVARYYSNDERIASTELARNIIPLGDYVTAVITNKVSRILSLLVASKSLGPDGDICFRSALALMRSAIALSTPNCHMNPHHFNYVEGSEGSSSIAAFYQISDDDLLNIDIDEMISHASTKRSFDSQGSQILRSARPRRVPTGVNDFDHLWFLLEHSLILAKPSLRFNISQNDEFLPLPPMSDGRALCERQSGGICCILAALATVRKNEFCNGLQELYQPVFLFDVTDTLRFDFNDFTYLKYIRHFLCGEVCRLSHISKACKYLVQSCLYEFLIVFLDAVVDASCLYEFPTSCLDAMEKYGGKKSRNRERVRLRQLRDASDGLKNTIIENPDMHAFGLNIIHDTAPDAPGPLYLCRSLWTFGQNLYEAISNNFSQPVNNKELAELSDILSDSIEEYRTLRGDFLNEIKEPSMESECIKRLTTLTRILTVFGLSPTENKIACISALLKSLIEQLSYVTEGYSYQMVTQNDPYSLAKFLILQESYAELTVAVISSILTCFRPQDLVGSLNVMTFFRDYIFSPSLRGSSIELSKLMRKALQSPPFPCGRVASRFPHVPFSICQTHERDISLKETELSNLSKAIGFASRRRLREIVLHTALGSFDGKSSLLPVFNEVIELATNPLISCSHDESHQQFAERFGASLGSLNGIYDPYEAFLHKSELNNIIDRYLSRNEISKERYYTLNRQLKALRWQTLQNFLIPKLSIKSAERRKLVLHILKGMFHSKDCGKSSQCSKSAVSLLQGSESDCFMCLYEHICPLIKGIILCVKEALSSFQIDWELVELLFQCSTSIILVEVEDEKSGDENEKENSLLHWSHHTFAMQGCSSYWHHAKYIFHFSKWMHSLASLLNRAETCEALHKYAFLTKDSSWRNETNDDQRLASFSSMLLTLLDLERDEQMLFAQVNENLSSRVINIYAKPVVENVQTTIENRPSTHTALGAMNELLVATSFYYC